MLDANPTLIKHFREFCDDKAFKIATSLIMTGIEAKCKNAFKVAYPIMLYFSSFSSFGLFARAGKGTLEWGLEALSISAVA